MTKTEILNYLELITGELTDAHHLTDTDGTVDANYSIHSAQELIDELRDNLEGKFDDDMSIFSENAFVGDVEGRLKGNSIAGLSQQTRAADTVSYTHLTLPTNREV